jgi:LacI family fructose operon transcriptional repressor
MMSIKDVAEEAGVSTATVSRVLSDKPHVRPEVRERVLQAADKLDYRPNRVAQTLRLQRSNTIGLIVADIRNPFFTSVSRAVEDMAYQQDMAVFLCNSDEDPEKETLYLNLLRGERVAGIILTPTLRTSKCFSEAAGLDIPIVVMDRRVEGVEIDSVLINNTESAHKIVTHLISDGRRRIAGTFGTGSITARKRRDGYVQALKDHGLQPATDLIRHIEAREEEGFKEAMRLMNLPEPPDAIFASNSLLAAGAFKAIRECGLAVPDEMAFAAFDKTTWTSLVEPPITVIEQPTYEMGQIATELLLRRIEDPTRPFREVILKGRLLIRRSCGHHD